MDRLLVHRHLEGHAPDDVAVALNRIAFRPGDGDARGPNHLDVGQPIETAEGNRGPVTNDVRQAAQGDGDDRQETISQVGPGRG